MSEKKYRIQTACPQCGCSAAAVMTDEEIRKRYGDAPNIHVTCDKCRAEYEAKEIIRNGMRHARWTNKVRHKQHRTDDQRSSRYRNSPRMVVVFRKFRKMTVPG
jgi:hypothetical protein